MATKLRDVAGYEETPATIDPTQDKHVTPTAVAYGGIKECATKFGGAPVLLSNPNDS